MLTLLRVLRPKPRPSAWGAGLCLLLAPRALLAATYYVAPAPAGDDGHDGSEASPFASMAKAQSAAKAGDTFYFRSGTYAYTKGTTTCKTQTDNISGVVLDKSGSAGNPIRYFAAPGERPILDFDGIRDSCRIKGILVSGDYIHLKGFELKGVRQNNDANHESWGVWIDGSHNILEALDVHHIMGAGIFIQRGGDNLVLNCDSHHNLDEHTSNGAGESADGFGCHVSAGESGNVFRGCRAWWNADDGYDFINADAACTVESSWAWYNGYVPDSLDPIGNGNGFKAGGYGLDPADFPADPAEHTVRSCLSFMNRAAGFYANHHPSSPFFYNNTAYANHPNFGMLGITPSGGDTTVGVYRNNVGLSGTMFADRENADEENNSWTLAGVTVSNADFQSVSPEGMDAPRNADGSLPVLPNFRLAPGSDLIDKGVDVKLPFAGTAPDLGAFEVGLAPPAGLGGGAGAGGGDAGGSAPVAGAGGASGSAATGGSNSVPPAGGGAAGAPVGGAVGSGSAVAGAMPGTGAASASGAGAASASGAGAASPSGTGAASASGAAADGSSCAYARGGSARFGGFLLAALTAVLLRRRERRSQLLPG